MKKLFCVVVCLVLMLSMTGCSTKDSRLFKNEYEALNGIKNEDGSLKYKTMNINSSNPIKYLTIEEVFEFFEGGTGFIYIGRPACPWCRVAIPIMFDTAKKEGLKSIYYYDIEKIRTDNTEEYQQLVDLLYDYLPIDTVTQSEDDENFDSTKKRIVVPDFYSVKEGKIVKHHQNTVPSHTSYKDDLNKVQTEELKNIFIEMFEEAK